MADARKKPNIFPTASDITPSGIPYVREEFPKVKIASDTTEIFRNARAYFEKYKVPERFRELEKSWWEIIPYIIASEKSLPLLTREGVAAKLSESIRSPQMLTPDTSSTLESPRIIHMARRRNPTPNEKKPANDWLLDWMWPLDAPGISSKIIWVDPLKLWKWWASAAKSLGAGSILALEGSGGESYIVLATRYPNYPKWSTYNIQTPYSSGLDTPELRHLGEKYLTSLITQGERDLMMLEMKNTPAIWGDMTLVKALIYVENMNEVNISASRKEREIFFRSEARKVAVLCGANGKDAFRRGSEAGAKGIVQITNWAHIWHLKKSWERNPGLRDEYKHREIPYDFHEMIESHRASVLTAYAHLDRQMREYRDHPDKSAYQWLLSEGKMYAPYILAAGYNSNNTGRVGDLLMVLRWNPPPEVVMQRFYHGLTNEFAEETRGYMKKVEYVMQHVIKAPIAPLPID